MKTLTTILIVLATTAGASLDASPVVYQKLKVGHVWAHVVTVDLGSPEVKVTAGIARRGRGSSEKFSSIMNRTLPKAAITGTFFDTRSLLPIGDIAIDGQVVHSGYFRTALCISPDNKASVVSQKRGTKADWSPYDTVMCGGITLARNGKIALSPKSEGFKDRALFRSARRTAIGITRSGKLLLVGINRGIYLRDTAHVMLKLGAVDALALDGGTSTALYYSGRSIATPGRNLTNVLLVYDNMKKYELAKNQLAPTVLTASSGTVQKKYLGQTVLASRPMYEGLFTRKPHSGSILLASEIAYAGPLVREPEISAAQ
jgi:hypothetical protein